MRKNFPKLAAFRVAHKKLVLSQLTWAMQSRTGSGEEFRCHLRARRRLVLRGRRAARPAVDLLARRLWVDRNEHRQDRPAPVPA